MRYDVEPCAVPWWCSRGVVVAPPRNWLSLWKRHPYQLRCGPLNVPLPPRGRDHRSLMGASDCSQLTRYVATRVYVP